MTKPKGSLASKRLIWRISELAPGGAWVDKGVRVTPKAGAQKSVEAHATWMTSTHDLMSGAEVSEITESDFDELFGQQVKPLKNPTDR